MGNRLKKEEKTVTGIILAGGRSRRMGMDKAFLELGGKDLIWRVLIVLRKIFERVVIVADTKERFKGFPCPIVCDVWPNRGPLGGIYTGLKYARNEGIFVAACDLPFLNPTLIRHLTGLLPGYEAVIPFGHGRCQPLHGVYSKQCEPKFQKWMSGEEYSLNNLLPTLVVRAVEESEIRRIDPQLASITNLNTPQDFKKAVIQQRRMSSCTP